MLPNFFKITILICLLFNYAYAQPVNDECATATSLGSLPTPAPCSGTAPSPGGVVNVAGTLVAATPASPYVYQTGCTGAGGTTMAVPANDVWYSFTATSYQAVITVNSTFANPNIALYAGTCGALGGGVGGCAVGVGGTATLTVEQMVIGTTYYIQVSGNTGQTGTFNMTVQNNKDCQDCLNASTLTVTPLPVAGAYAPGTVVNFCYKINQYTQVNTNWLHGVQVAFGPCWNLASLTTAPPPACQTAPAGGTWAWYGSCTSTATFATYPAGFYFDTTDPGTNPGNNFGDNCTGIISAANWNFCFTIAVSPICSPGCNLSVTINTSGDGESGSWSSLGCIDDPATTFNAVGACCPPTMASTPSCVAPATGTATATPVGGAGPYTYTWTNSLGVVVSTTSGVVGANTATGLIPGTYTVSIINASGCLATNTVVVGTSPAPVVLVNSPTYCVGASAVLTASGASTYTWSPAGGLSATTGTSVTANPIVTTVYTVTGTSVAGCTATATSTVTVNPLPVINCPAATICFGASTVLTASGASTYSWSPAGGLSATTGTSVTANPVVTTVYTITGTSAAGCVGTTTVTVTVNPLPVINCPAATICNGASTVLTASGASTYAWSPATGLSAATGASVTANPTATTTYTITGTSAAGCVGTTTVTVTVNPNPVVNVNSGSICVGASIVLTATGATTYSWSPPGGLSATTGASVTANPVVTTVYTVVGTSLGCTGSATSTVTINANLDATITPAGPFCAGDPIIIMTAVDGGGTWSATCGVCINSVTGSFDPSLASVGSNTITYTILGACGSTDTEVITINPNNISTFGFPPIICVESAPVAMTPTQAGGTWSATCGACINSVTGVFDPALASVGANTITYTFVGTCGSTTSNIITVDQVIILGIASNDVSCFGLTDGTITINAPGASQFSNDGGLTFQASNVFTVGAGTYNIQVLNANGCVDNGTATVNEPPLLTIAAGTLQDETCFGDCDGQVAGLPAGGTNPYVVTWTGPTPGSGLSLTNVCPGLYTATVTDFNGCTASATATVIPAILVSIVSVTPTNPTCNGGTNGQLVIVGSATVTQYSIDGGATFQASGTFTGLIAGNYVCVVIDANGCSATQNITLTQPALLTVSSSLDVNICVGGNTTISATAMGGTGPYSYQWDDPTNATTSAVNVSPAITTTYNVVVTDANGCGPVFESVTVTVGAPLSVNALTFQTICPGTSANITANGLGGSGVYTYTWSNDQNVSILTGQNQTVSPTTTTTTIYTVTLTDNCGTPPVTDTVSIAVYILPLVTFTSDFTQGCAPLAINFTNTMTASAITNCLWDFGDGTTSTNCNDSHVYTTAGCYNVTFSALTNPGGCPVTATINSMICVFPIPIADFTFGPQPTDIYNTTINFVNTSVGASTYAWDFAGLGTATTTNPTFTFPNDSGATYTVCLEVLTNQGCYDSTCHQVVIMGEFLIYVPNAFTPDGDGVNDIFIPIIRGEDPLSYDLMIFNRWGELIFQSNNKKIGWDGTHKSIKSKEDVYVWKIKVKKKDNGDKMEYIGHVTLLR